MSTLPPVSNSLFAMITGDPTISAIIGTRLFPSVAPTGTEDPWIAYQRISGKTETAHDGQSGIREASYQFSIFSTDQGTCETLREALIDLLDATRTEIDGADVVILHENDHDTYEVDTRYYSSVVEFTVMR